MSNTPNWDKFCEFSVAINTAKEQIDRRQKWIMSVIQHDMNTPGEDNTDKILEDEANFKALLEIAQPVMDTLKKIKPPPEQSP